MQPGSHADGFARQACLIIRGTNVRQVLRRYVKYEASAQVVEQGIVRKLGGSHTGPSSSTPALFLLRKTVWTQRPTLDKTRIR